MSATFCRDHRKRAHSSYPRADRIRRRANRRNRADLDAGSVYWCPESGAFHVTSWSRGDVDRYAARRLNPCSGDNPGAAWGRKNNLDRSGDNSGAASRNSTRIGLEILLAGRASRDSTAGQETAAHPTPGRTASDPAVDLLHPTGESV